MSDSALAARIAYTTPAEDAELEKIVKGNGKQRAPMAGTSRNAGTGEGTRYGRRPVRSSKKHLPSPRKPQQ